MKKLLIIIVALITTVLSLANAGGYITLMPGQTIDINGTSVTCSMSAPQDNPIATCNRFKSMKPSDVYQVGFTEGVGYCTIINNEGYYGVLHVKKGQQISPTYSEAFGSGQEYDRYSHSAATALVQLVCNNTCFNP